MTPPASLEADASEAAGRAAGAEPCPAEEAVRRFRFELAAQPGSAAQARRMTRAWLSAWDIGADTCDSAELVVSELVTNAIVHTDSRQIVCELREDPEKLRIAVCDEGRAPGEPRPSAVRDEEEHGRGLFLVSAVCSAWGAHETGPGLLVWAELPSAAGDDRTATETDADGVRGTGAAWVS
ncbi:ATP-binding protein [Streptomyces sp. NPDC050560]|uniref:ATP-binding protein n=1 Tax=Streptomyces sp. NPDC050560 TaxID=3365630 RepID=UPI003793BDA7